MLRGDDFIFMGVGALFIFLGLVGIFFGYVEEGVYNSSLSRRFDLREFVERLPKWPQPGALRVGGWISIGVGVVLVAIGLFSYFG